jgi:hypothetical protein
MTALQLFKSFFQAFPQVDTKLMILPVDSTRQNFTSIINQKQLDQLTQNQLKLYLTQWHKDNANSIGGFIHISTILTLPQILTSLPLAEWFTTYDYSTKLCSSQDEEMNIIGALCYGSLFLYREDLFLSIKSHPSWIALKKD